MDKRLTFHLRPPKASEEQFGASRLIFSVFAVLMVAFLWWAFSDAWAALRAVDWALAWESLMGNPVKLVVPVVYVLLIAPATYVMHKRLRNARLVLDDSELRYESGVPWLSRWIDWKIDLQAIRSQELSFRIMLPPGVPLSSKTYAVEWGAKKHSGDRSLQTLRPADWYPANAEYVVPKRSFLALPTTLSTHGAAAMQAQLQALPLVQALTQRAILLPPITSKSDHLGVDLMAYARLRMAVFAFFALLLMALLLMLFVRHSYYFEAPPIAVWVVCGGVVGAMVLAWLSGEAVAAQAQRPGLHLARVVVAALVGLAFGLCAPSVPLAYANLLQAPQTQVDRVLCEISIASAPWRTFSAQSARSAEPGCYRPAAPCAPAQSHRPLAVPLS